MRDKEKKHRKGQESTIGKIIYGFLLFMPLIAIGVTCLYAIFNKNAYLSFATDSKVENVYQITDTDNLISDNTYYISLTDNESVNYNTSSGRLKFIETNLLDKIATFDNNDYSNVNAFSIGYLSGYFLKNTLALWQDTTLIKYWQIGIDQPDYVNKNLLNNIFFTFDTKIGSDHTIVNSWYMWENVINSKRNINDVFYYAVEKTEKSNLFNWAQNSVIYTTTNATCNALSITTPFIPLLLAYWLIISIIYFLYDIALMLVWMLHRKIHELQESL